MPNRAQLPVASPSAFKSPPIRKTPPLNEQAQKSYRRSFARPSFPTRPSQLQLFQRRTEFSIRTHKRPRPPQIPVICGRGIALETSQPSTPAFRRRLLRSPDRRKRLKRNFCCSSTCVSAAAEVCAKRFQQPRLFCSERGSKRNVAA